jgi:hypothetical protein
VLLRLVIFGSVRPWPSRAAATKRPSSPSSIASLARPRRSRNTDQAKRTLTRHRARQTHQITDLVISFFAESNQFVLIHCFNTRPTNATTRILFAAMLYAFAAFWINETLEILRTNDSHQLFMNAFIRLSDIIILCLYYPIATLFLSRIPSRNTSRHLLNPQIICYYNFGYCFSNYLLIVNLSNIFIDEIFISLNPVHFFIHK